MYDILKAVADRITAEVHEIKWVDEDFGQLDISQDENGRPDVVLPCALITVQQQFEHVVGDSYNANSTITVRVAIDRKGQRTSGKADDLARTASFERLSFPDKVRDSLTDYDLGETGGKLYLSGYLPEPRTDGLAVKILTFTETH